MLSYLWKITLFGGLRLDSAAGGTVPRFATQKTGLLLAYLALYRDRPAPARENLAELLWPEARPESARQSLRQAVTSLRRQLEPPGTPRGSVLIAHGHHSLALNPEAVEVDTLTFEAALRHASSRRGTPDERAALETAVALYTTDLLPGFFDDWVLTERQRLLETCRAALRSLIALCEARDTDAAITHAQRLASLSPLDETAHGDLIRLYLAANRPDDARQHYAAYARRLSEHMGEAPSPELTALITAVPLTADSAKTPTLQTPTPNTSTLYGQTSVSALPHRTPDTGQRIADPDPRHLPTPLTRFFGRVEEKERITNLLQDAPTRLVTLTGPGGSGKTRLAVEVARVISRERFPGVVALVALDGVTDAARLPETVRATLAVGGFLPARPTGEPFAEVAARLNEAPSLLVLDNFEQFGDEGTPFVRELLERAPNLTCLITSRRSLSIPGEREMPVPPLPTPPLPGTPARLLEFASVQLFVDRAQAVRPDFQVTPRNAEAMAALCHRLDGIPLAIELAAARARALAPAQIISQLDDRFAFLQSRDPNAPARHRTLFAAVDGSVRVLLPELRRFFLRLAVFRGGWTLDAAGAVAGQAGEAATLDALERLCQASLVVPTDTGAVVRFRMLETLREYALAEISEEDRKDAELRHAACFTGFAEAAAKELVGPGQAEALRALDIEQENLRIALTTLIREGDTAGQLRLVAAQALYWAMRGAFREGRAILTETFAAAEALSESDAPDTTRLRTRIADALAAICAQSGDFDTADQYARRSLALSRHLQDDFGMARSLNNLGSVAVDRMRWQEAEAFLTEGLTCATKTGNRQMVGAMRNNLALALLETGRPEQAAVLYAENLALRRELGDSRGIALTLLNLGDLHIRRRDGDAACRLYRESLDHLRELGDLPLTAIALEGLGEALLLTDTPANNTRCAVLFGVAATIRERTGAQRRPHFQAAYPRFEAQLRERLGDVEFRRRFDQGQHTTLEQVMEEESGSLLHA